MKLFVNIKAANRTVKFSDTERLCILIEPSASGHRMTYAEKFLSDLGKKDFNRIIIFTCETEREHPAVRKILDNRNLPAELRLIPASDLPKLQFQEAGFLGLLVASFRRLALYRRLLAQVDCRPDLVLTMSADVLWPAIAVFPRALGRCFSGVFMRTRFHWSAVGIDAPVRRFEALNGLLMKRLLQRSSQTMMTFDHTLPEYIAQHWPHLRQKMNYLPDPIVVPNFDKKKVRAALGISGDDAALAIMGLSARKGENILREALRSGKWPCNWSVLLVGGNPSVVGDIASAAHAAGVRTYEFGGFVSDEAWMQCICASDLVWAVYPGHYGPSGVIESAKRAGRPFLAWGRGLGAREARTILGAKIVNCAKDVTDALDSHRNP